MSCLWARRDSRIFPHLTVAEMSAATGISAHTLQYYERAGLIRPVVRSSGNQGRYSPADVESVKFLLRLRETGMLIAQMSEYAILREDGAITTEPHLRLLEEHQAGLREQIARLRAHEKALATKIARRSCQPPISHGTEETMTETTKRQQRFEYGNKMLDKIDGEGGQMSSTR